MNKAQLGALVVVVAGCGAGPRYADRPPPAPTPTGCVVDQALVQLTSTGSSTSFVSTLPNGRGRHPDATSAELYSSVTVSTDRSASGSRGIAIAPFPDFGMRSDLIARSERLPDHAQRVGDLRTRDLYISPDDYQKLLCGWTDHVENRELEAQCRTGGDRNLDLLLGRVQRDAAMFGADRVHDVRCFGRNEERGLRVWCEGVAYLTACSAAGPIRT